MAIRPYLVSCKKCGVQKARNNRYTFVCNNCKDPKKYPRVFYKNRLIALKRDKNECQCCGVNKRLVVHHLDCNPKNNSPSNLITLCKSCHGHIHGKYTKKKLRRSNIYELLPKITRIGRFGTRFDKLIIRNKEIKKIKRFKNT